jgi:hypothetical protein
MAQPIWHNPHIPLTIAAASTKLGKWGLIAGMQYHTLRDLWDNDTLQWATGETMWEWAPHYYTQTQLTNTNKNKITQGAQELISRIPDHFTRLAILGPKPYQKGEMIYDMDNQTLGQIKHLGEQAMSIRVWSHTYENLPYKTNRYVGVTYGSACRAITGKGTKQRTTLVGPSETRNIDPSKWKIDGKPINKITAKYGPD